MRTFMLFSFLAALCGCAKLSFQAIQQDSQAAVAPTCELSSNVQTISAGQSVALSLKVTGTVLSASLQGEAIDTKTGSFIEMPSATTTYRVTVGNTAGNSSCSTTVSVESGGSVGAPIAPTCVITATPPTVAPGEPVVLTLKPGGNGSVSSAKLDTQTVSPAGGSITVTPTESTAYSGAVFGPGGLNSCNVPVTVSSEGASGGGSGGGTGGGSGGGTGGGPSPTCSIALSPSVIAKGESASLRIWVRGLATSAELNGAAYSLSSTGLKQSPSSSQVFSATVSGPGGTGTCTATLEVYPPPSCVLTASPSAIPQGAAATLALQIDGKVYNTSINGISVIPSSSGSANQTVRPNATETFTALIGGPGGNASCSAQVTVLPPPPTCSLTIPFINGKGTSNPQAVVEVHTTGQVASGTVNGKTVADLSQTVLVPVTPGMNTVVASVTGPGGENACSTTFDSGIPAPFRCTLQADSSHVAVGGGTTLHFAVTSDGSPKDSATLTMMQNGVARKWPNGSYYLPLSLDSEYHAALTVNPIATTVYQAMVEGSDSNPPATCGPVTVQADFNPGDMPVVLGGSCETRPLSLGGDNVIRNTEFITRLTQSGVPNTYFGKQGSVVNDTSPYQLSPRLMQVTPQGKIVLAGQGQVASGTQGSFLYLHRFNRDGTVDSAFGTQGFAKGAPQSTTAHDVSQFMVADSGLTNLFALGMHSLAVNYDAAVARIGMDANYVPSFGQGGLSIVSSIGVYDYTRNILSQPTMPWLTVVTSKPRFLTGLLQEDGKLLVGGDVFVDGGIWDVQERGGDHGVLARFNPDGSLDTSFGHSGFSAEMATDGQLYGFAPVTKMARQLDGKILVAAGASYNLDERFRVCRVNASGKGLDSSFGGIGCVDILSAYGFGMATLGTSEVTITSLVVAPDGKILVAGTLGLSGTISEILRLNPDGSPDASFGREGHLLFNQEYSPAQKLAYSSIYLLDFNVSQMIFQPDGKILMLGFENSAPFRVRVERFNTDGSFDTGFANQGIYIQENPNDKQRCQASFLQYAP